MIEMCGRTLLGLRASSSQILKGLTHSRDQSLRPQQKIYPNPLNYLLPFPSLTEEINPSLSAKPAVVFPEGDARQDNTDVPQGPTVVASRQIARHKT